MEIWGYSTRAKACARWTRRPQLHNEGSYATSSFFFSPKHPVIQTRVITTHPWVVLDQPVSLLRQQVGRDLLSHLLHTVAPSLLLQVLGHHRPEGHKADNPAPICGPVCKKAPGYWADKTCIFSVIQWQFVDHTFKKKINKKNNNK